MSVMAGSESVLGQLDGLDAIERVFPKPRLTELMPEQRLMVALFVDALSCLEQTRSFNGSHDADFLDAAAWVMSDEEAVFSFTNVCDTLGLDKSSVRQRLKATYRLNDSYLVSADLHRNRTGRKPLISVPDWFEYGYDHSYVSFNHCGSCRRRYNYARAGKLPDTLRTRPGKN